MQRLACDRRAALGLGTATQAQRLLAPTNTWRTARPAAARTPARLQAAASSSSSSSVTEVPQTAELKQQLRESIQGINRGIFGVPAAKRQQVAAILESLESLNPLQQPTQHLDQLAGDWVLLYTTISITGVKKTKLGLREFVRLGDFVQQIDTTNQMALNVIQFSVAGLGMLSGSLTVKAAYQVESDSRVAINFMESTLVPKQLQDIFQANYELLLSIFNPQGWLDITYVDSELRVGRDDKGNIFVLERAAQAGSS